MPRPRWNRGLLIEVARRHGRHGGVLLPGTAAGQGRHRRRRAPAADAAASSPSASIARSTGRCCCSSPACSSSSPASRRRRWGPTRWPMPARLRLDQPAGAGAGRGGAVEPGQQRAGRAGAQALRRRTSPTRGRPGWCWRWRRRWPAISPSSARSPTSSSCSGRAATASRSASGPISPSARRSPLLTIAIGVALL